MRNLVCGAIVFMLIAAPGAADTAPAANDYTAASSWLCRPGAQDACAIDDSATTFNADGTTSVTSYKPDPNAPVDCFYVYPTVSRERQPNSDMTVDPEERHVVEEQLVPFGTVCRLFAPMYRQVTLSGLVGGGGDDALAYRDVFDAWHEYLAHANGGRGAVLIGHSQGANILSAMVADQIDGKSAQAKLISAILLGASIDVPVGKGLGGTFDHVPLCSTQHRVGCIIAYSSFLATHEPDANSYFGKSDRPGMIDACVDPVALDGAQSLDAAIPALGRNAVLGTTYVRVPRVLTDRCTRTATSSFLAVTIGDDARAGRVSTTLAGVDALLPGWGLHALDVNLALGNLVDIVKTQSHIWLRQTRKP